MAATTHNVIIAALWGVLLWRGRRNDIIIIIIVIIGPMRTRPADAAAAQQTRYSTRGDAAELER